MATRPAVNSFTNGPSAFVVTWTALANGDDGQPVQFAQFADRTVQFTGTFGVGGTARFEGSNDGVNWAPLTDPLGTTIDATGPRIKLAVESPAYVRPRITGGDGTTSINVSVLLKE